MTVRQAAQALIDYENTGAPDYLDWDRHFENLRAALAEVESEVEPWAYAVVDEVNDEPNYPPQFCYGDADPQTVLRQLRRDGYEGVIVPLHRHARPKKETQP